MNSHPMQIVLAIAVAASLLALVLEIVLGIIIGPQVLGLATAGVTGIGLAAAGDLDRPGGASMLYALLFPTFGGVLLSRITRTSTRCTNLT